MVQDTTSKTLSLCNTVTKIIITAGLVRYPVSDLDSVFILIGKRKLKQPQKLVRDFYSKLALRESDSYHILSFTAQPVTIDDKGVHFKL